ncbi:M23 family metallopeptidase [Streptomyces tsukubensis]|uniref:M23 family metallopeptidase n=1 Tax=Streptomyces tsukubensis TaxID=83656 RepID=UPI001D0458E1|nr:M23 family metallopeptidase [Streptomyces tsukubensis]
MNDRHPSGTAIPPASVPGEGPPQYAAYDQGDAPYGYPVQPGYQPHDGYPGNGAPAAAFTYDVYGNAGPDTGTFDTVTGTGTFPVTVTGTDFTGGYPQAQGYAPDQFYGDPGTGSNPAVGGPYDTGQYDTAQYGSGQYDTGQYDTGLWNTGTHETLGGAPLNHDPYAAQHTVYDTGQFTVAGQEHGGYGTDTGAYDTSGSWPAVGTQTLPGIPAQPSPDVTGQWNAEAWNQADLSGTQQWPTHSFDTADTGGYDATSWNSGARAAEEALQHPGHQHPGLQHPELQHPDSTPGHRPQSPEDQADPDEPDEPGAAVAMNATDGAADADSRSDEHGAAPEPELVELGHGGGRSRSRRRTPAKRSALLTIAVPSACVMGVAGVAAATVGDFGGGEKEAVAATAPDAAPVKPSTANNKLDTQLADLSAAASDVADRASRTQERIDLKAKKEEDRKAAAKEAARKERLRPKFVLPVTQRGLSAHFGQAGVNWMSAHTGIDFPVSYGTTVMAATDGTVQTKWNSAYGNMAILTAKDGTETWYCHLSSNTVQGGTVKAGDVIARSGNSGNSTGPHMHFEVRPGGGAAIDPLPWLRSHGLNPE